MTADSNVRRLPKVNPEFPSSDTLDIFDFNAAARVRDAAGGDELSENRPVPAKGR
jgi:hypothetical protein